MADAGADGGEAALGEGAKGRDGLCWVAGWLCEGGDRGCWDVGCYCYVFCPDVCFICCGRLDSASADMSGV